MMYDSLMWALGRGAGLTAFALLTLAMILGVVAFSGRAVLRVPRFAWQSMHRNAALTAVVLVVVHVIALMLDPYAQLTLPDALIPFLADTSTFWVGLGAVAFDLLVALAVTGLARRRIGPRAFHVIHLSAYALWPVAAAHAIGTGSDLSTWSAIVVVIGVGGTAWVLSMVQHVRSASWSAGARPLPVRRVSGVIERRTR